MSSVSNSPVSENPWLMDEGSFDSAFSTPQSSPSKAQRVKPALRKRNAEFEVDYSPRKPSPFSSPGSSPYKRQRTSSLTPIFERMGMDIPKKVDYKAKRELFPSTELPAGLFSSPLMGAIDDDELKLVEIEIEEEISKIFQTTLSGKKLLAVQFSQNSISDTTKDDELLTDVIRNLAKKGWDRGKAPMNLVEWPDGKLTSMDNRRLYCAKKCAKEMKSRLVVPVNIHDHTAAADPSYLIEIAGQVKRVGAATLGPMPREIVPNSWGYCNWVRMRVFNKTPVDPQCYGFTELPRTD